MDYHEAGHAVEDFYVAFVVSSVTIEPGTIDGEDYLGLTDSVSERDLIDDPDKRRGAAACESWLLPRSQGRSPKRGRLAGF